MVWVVQTIAFSRIRSVGAEGTEGTEGTEGMMTERSNLSISIDGDRYLPPTLPTAQFQRISRVSSHSVSGHPDSLRRQTSIAAHSPQAKRGRRNVAPVVCRSRSPSGAGLFT